MGCYRRSALGERPSLTNPAKARAYCASLFYGLFEECVYLISLDQGSRVIRRTLLRRGTVNEVTLYPREVVEAALRDHAYAVLLAHNHPGGMCEPSQADYTVTQDIVKALRLVGVQMMDHLIVTGSGVFSMMGCLQVDSVPEESSRPASRRANALRENLPSDPTQEAPPARNTEKEHAL